MVKGIIGKKIGIMCRFAKYDLTIYPMISSCYNQYAVDMDIGKMHDKPTKAEPFPPELYPAQIV